MDPNGYGDPRGYGQQQYPQVRVEVPQRWISEANTRAVQHNEAYSQLHQAQSSVLPSHQYPVQAGNSPPRSSPNNVRPHAAPGSSATAQSAAANPARLSQVDYPLLLISLAEEYFAAAYGSDASGSNREPDPDKFRRLISTGLACLEAVLKQWRLPPAVEASVRLCYGSIVFEETTSLMEAEECLSKGISHCEQYRLLDMKYNMQHLLARVTFATNPKAALKFVDTVIQAAEAEQHVPWVYALRLLRSSLALRSGSSQEILNAISNLKVISSLANSRGDAAVSATAALFEAMAHLIRTNVPESIENAQTALAAARAVQFNPLANGTHQLIVIGHLVDLCCHIYRDEMENAMPLMKPFIDSIDSTLQDKPWAPNGVFLVPLASQSASTLPAIGSSNGVICRNDQGNTCIQMFWLPKDEIHPLGSLICAAVNLHRNSQSQKAEDYLKEAAGLIDSSVQFTPASKPVETWQQTLRCHAQTNLVFALCGRSAWGSAQKELSSLRDMAQKLPVESAKPVSLYVLYLEGAISQGTGDTTTALSIFRRPEFAIDNSKKSPPSALQRDLSILAALNVALIVHVPDHPQRSSLPDLVAALEPLGLANPSTSIRAACRFVRAVAFDAAGASPTTGGGASLLKTKENLSAVLQDAKRTANVQLLCLTLNFMAEKYFRGVVGEQALKSARTALQFARRGQNDLWTSVADGLLADAFETQGRGEEAANTRREAGDLAARLPAVMQRTVDDGQGASGMSHGM